MLVTNPWYEIPIQFLEYVLTNAHSFEIPIIPLFSFSPLLPDDPAFVAGEHVAMKHELPMSTLVVLASSCTDACTSNTSAKCAWHSQTGVSQSLSRAYQNAGVGLASDWRRRDGGKLVS